jgi:tRNA pseudouridine38-40 synthase
LQSATGRIHSLLLESMARYQVILAYDGTQFQGFQRQSQRPTVQGAVEEALRQIGWSGRTILASGRTDSGAHATGQVIAFDLEWAHPLQSLQAALNAHLPWCVVARSVALVEDDFHPRYSAAGRRYQYRIYCQPERDPFRERFAWRLWPPLDVDVLHRVSQQFLGTHDYVAFGTPPKPGGATVRTVTQVGWSLTGGWVGLPELLFEVVANAFLYRMVRRMVYIQVAVAQGRLDQDLPTRLLESPPPKPVQGLAPAYGLTLVEVYYPRAG